MTHPSLCFNHLFNYRVFFPKRIEYMEGIQYWFGGFSDRYAVVQFNYIYLSSNLPANLLSGVSISHSMSCHYYAITAQLA